MQSSLKKSLYLGLAAASFVAAAGATTANASAKSYAKAGSYSTLTTAAASRNVNLTGTNAIYTKPGTVKGAKVVATTATAAKLSKSSNGQANFRAYGVKTTDRGSVYYKVVSFDKAYRGYVYGGKSTSAFAGGLAAYATTKDATAPAAGDKYSLTADTSSTANTLFFKEPAWTNYKVGRAKVNGTVLAKTDAYKGAQFTFNKAVTTSREGETWYEISSTTLANGAKSTDLNGAWVKASNVSNPKADPAATSDNSIKVVYRLSNGNTVGDTKTFVNNGAKKVTKVNDVYAGEQNNAGQDLPAFAKAASNVPSGYTVTDTSSTQTPQYGGTYYVTVAQASTSKVDLYVQEGSAAVPFTVATSNKLTLTPTQQSTLLTGPTTDNVDLTALANAFHGTNGQTLYSATKNSDGKYDAYTVGVQQTVNANTSVKFGQNVRLVLVKGTAVDSLPSTTPAEQANSDFLN
ncbi:S-layer protein [Lactobacillus sp. LC28-10]|uniref:S-layer protein n=1 Tax=Secundilactobacillus angelensis TaxID=2722706 RepID=A0ABX1KYS9_9LACO|nr:S-layer protein [Secundilactobacillus angelensis]MCH5461667.1 S-layer protein [Secundilactobacillus angelensis]NLR17963.1 S-layer protein [Secundilactobacillus angelensis]